VAEKLHQVEHTNSVKHRTSDREVQVEKRKTTNTLMMAESINRPVTRISIGRAKRHCAIDTKTSGQKESIREKLIALLQAYPCGVLMFGVDDMSMEQECLCTTPCNSDVLLSVLSRARVQPD
jgi:hypothetical protein